ncbi:MAG: threonine/serine exporter family protein [Anaerolineae bacterium]|nr:threonine/serine exporter family protein [Anaerolineae bacterium]
MVVSRASLNYEELRHVIDLALWAGQLLLQHGAETQRIEETVHRMGTGLGCDWVDILISPNGLLITTNSGGDFRTKFRRVVRMGVNMNVVAEINELSRRVDRGEYDRFKVETELRRISDQPHNYNRRVVVGMVGLSCAAFSQLFGGDFAALVVTFGASALAMLVRQELQVRHFNTLMTVIITAFVAGLITGAAGTLLPDKALQTALAASVLLLVPGVPLINAAEDLLKGHILMGIVRGANGALISLAIALGLLLAMALTGVTGL